MVSVSDIFIYILNSNFLLTNLIIGLILLIITAFLIKKQKISLKSEFTKWDLIFGVPFLIYMIFTIAFPDLSWDTRSYHIYLQENVFADKINSDFFAGRNLNSFLFALGDRINYLFRLILGYRLGTIMTYYLIVILFYQSKRLLKNFLKDKKDWFIVLPSCFLATVSVAFSYSGTYYIDNFSLIFLMEIFLIVFFEKDVLKDKFKLYTLALIIGFSISIKVTNAVFLIALAIYFIIKNRKDFRGLKIYNYLIFLVLAIIPWAIYAIDNYIQTGNPVFPYYNNIFKSEFFMESSWVDQNFGPQNLIQFLIWPIYIVFNPKRAFDTRFVDFTWALGFIFIAGNIVNSILKKNFKNDLFILSIIVFINYYLWEKFLIGYVRYATILLVLSLGIAVVSIDKIFEKHKKSGIILFCIFIIASLPSLGYDLLVKVKDYSSITEIFSEYKNNLKNIFRDRNVYYNFGEDAILGAIGDDSLLPTMLENGNKIYNLEEWVTITNDKTREMYEEKIFDKIIYVPVDELTRTRKEEYLEENSFEILEITELDGDFMFLSSSNKLYLYKVRKIVH